ncbi:unnamed protein product [Closterium sp. NIES-54]
MWLTVHWLVTRLPDRLATARDLPTFTATRASATVSVVEDIAAVSAADWQKRGRVARRAGREVEEAVVVAVELGAVVVVEAAVVPQEEGALEEVQDRHARLLAVFRPAGVSDLSSSSHISTSHSKDSSTSRDRISSRHRNSSSHGGPHCSGVRSSTGAPCRSGVQEDQGAPAAAAAVPAGPLAPLAMTPASMTIAVARSSTTLPCPVVPSGVLRGLHIPSFTRNLVGVGYLQDRGITVTFMGGGRTAVTASPQAPAPPPVVESRQVAASPPVVAPGQVAASFSCRSFTHRTVLWHHHLGHPTIPRLRTMASLRLFSGLPRVFPSFPPSPAPPCTPCVDGRLCVAPHSSSLRPSFFRVWGCLALVHDTSADKLLARAVPYVFLGFPVASVDWSFYHPPLHQFLDSCDVRFDESVSYYTRYPCRGLPAPPPPLFLAPSLPPAPAPSVPPPPPGPAPSGVSHATPLPSVARQVASPSPQSSSHSPQQPSALPRQVTVDSVGVGAGGAATGGTRSGGARSRGAGAGGASSGGARAGGAGMGGASSGGARVGGLGTGGARTGGAGAGDPDPVRTPSGDTGSEGASSEATGAGGTTSAESTPPPHRHDRRPAGSSPPPQSPPPIVRHYRSRPCPPSARPSSLVTDLHTALLYTSLRRSPPPVSVLPSPPPSSLLVSPTPISNYYRDVRPVVSRVLATVTDPRFSPSSVLALTASVADFAAASRLDYSNRVVPAPPTHPLSVGGEFALGCDVLQDRHSELDYVATASPTLCAMLLSPKGDPDALDIPTPCTYREAVSGPWASQWKAAMDSDLASWRSTGTYVDAVPLPRANVVDGMWLFKEKRPPGSPPRDYGLHSVDFSTAFLQGRLHEEMWLRRPPSFTGTFPTRTQWSLRRPVYGLRQSPREWHDTLRSTLRDLGFHPSSTDPSLFVRAGSTPFFILVYGNDLVFATPDKAALAEVKSELQKRHTCTDLGELQRYLGLQITRDRAARTITLTQSHMVQQVLQRFGLLFSTTQPTPLAVDHRLTGPFPDEPFEPSGPYPELVGCLMYLLTCTRPDLAYPLSVLSRFVGPGRHRHAQWTAVVRVATYLATTSGMGLVLGGTRPVELTGLCDSSYPDDVETQRSTQGYCFSLGVGAVSWRSTRSSLVASSSAEAEIYAGAMAAQELR